MSLGSLKNVINKMFTTYNHYKCIRLPLTQWLVFANGSGDRGSISGWVIPMTQKMELDASLVNTQHYKVGIKGKVEQPIEKEQRPPLHFGVSAIEKGAFWSPPIKVAKFTNL